MRKREEEGAGELRGCVSEMRRSVWRGDLIRARGMGRGERSTKPAGDGGGGGGDSFWGRC